MYAESFRMTTIRFAVRALVLLIFASTSGLAADWPMWRFDAYRSASSPEELPSDLHLQWTRKDEPRVQVWDDPLNHDLMPYDKLFEPVILGSRLFVGFNDTDKVVAFDLETGEELWRFYAGGPVRLPPVGWAGKIYFTSDDGYLYCLAAENGRLKWRFRGGPSERKALGNHRLISAWPARGGPVLRDGKVYFAASIWPFMGTFIYSLDAETGAIVWVNDGTAAQFIKQPHSAPSFAGVAPQGALVAAENILLVPGGRSVPAAFDRHTGEFLYFHLNDGGKGNGGSLVIANELEFFVHTRQRGVRAFELQTGIKTTFAITEPVLADGWLYFAGQSSDGNIVQAFREQIEWELAIDASGDLIKAGRRLYAAGQASLTAIELPQPGELPRVSWSKPIDGQVMRLLAGNGKLVTVTLDGRISVYGSRPTAAPTSIEFSAHPLRPFESVRAKAQSILQSANIKKDEYVLWFGVDDEQLFETILTESQARVVAVDPDREKIERLRRRLDHAGLYGQRCSAHFGDPASFSAPPYIAHLIIMGESAVPKLQDPTVLAAVFESVRPYGGALWLPAPSAEHSLYTAAISRAGLENAQVKTGPDHLTIIRAGPLPGAADWTHQYGNIANTVKSDDSRVKAPLGLLWFGGSSNMDVLPRHGHGPPEQVIGGRAFIQGMNSISARDVYTGRLIWHAQFDDLGTFGIYYDASYTNTPLSTAYNQKHIPGANARGSNMIATDDAVYLAVSSSCRVLDAETGQLRQNIHLPNKPGSPEPPKWGFIGVYDNLLLGGDGFALYNQKISQVKTNSIEDFSASDGLVIFDRHSGAVRWRVDARHSFLHNGIVAGNGRIYCLDKLPQSAEDKLKRRGFDVPTTYRIAAFDAQTGALIWETQQNIFGTWLSYSKQHDVLLLAGAKASDRLADEVGQGMTAYRGATGEMLWQDLARRYTGPCILHNDLILTSANSYQASSGAFSLLTGVPHWMPNPLTGRLEPWRLSRSYGCNSIVASENLLTFRSGAAGFYDLISKSGTANLGGFRSGCTANLVVANGVLNAPDYTRTCSCAYQNQTSLALVPMPDIEMWAHSVLGLDAEEGEPIARVGINFGAPGDRRTADGTLWLEFPTVGGDSPSLHVTVNGEKSSYFRRHTSQVDGAGPIPWVAASGVRDPESITIIPRIIRPPIPAKGKADEIEKKIEDKDDKNDQDETDADETPKNTPELTVKSAAAEMGPTAQPRLIPYTVRIVFAEPDQLRPGERVFNVWMQGNLVLENFDTLKAAGGPNRGVIKEFRHVAIQDELLIRFQRTPHSSVGPVVCGIELLAETDRRADAQ